MLGREGGTPGARCLTQSVDRPSESLYKQVGDNEPASLRQRRPATVARDQSRLISDRAHNIRLDQAAPLVAKCFTCFRASVYSVLHLEAPY